MDDMKYDGQVLTWDGKKYKATSGMPGNQNADKQHVPDAGPVPAGRYKVYLGDLGAARISNPATCSLAPAWGVESIPRGRDAGACEPYWANWGKNRVRMEATDPSRTYKRGGFYLHDSTKGFSHGCIEIDSAFFTALRNYSQTTRRRHLVLHVEYAAHGSTYGGTRV